MSSRTPVLDLSEICRVWIEENTSLASARSGEGILRLMLWIEEELFRQPGWTAAELIAKCRPVGNSSPHWVKSTYRIEHGGRRPATPEEQRSCRVGRSQQKGAKAQFWYAVPPIPEADLDQLAIPA